MDADVPTSQQWVWFSTVLKKSVSVEWKENNETNTGLYYVQKCYWGFLVDPNPKTTATTYIDWPFQTATGGNSEADDEHPNGVQRKLPQVRKDVKMEIVGETKLFIAQEYIEPDFQGGPMVNHHLRDLANLEPKGDDAWIALKLDENVHYGQNGSGKGLRRWLVYHPPIARNGESPAIFQHRFTGLESADILSGGIEVASKNLLPGGLISDAVDKLVKPAINVLKAAVGHFLHTFLSSVDVDEARWLVANATASEKQFSKRDPKNHLLALQIVETHRLARQNAATDEGTSERIQAYEALKNDLERESKWYNDNIKILPRESPGDVYQTLVQTGIPMRRDADFHSQQIVVSKFHVFESKFGQGVAQFRPYMVQLPQNHGVTVPNTSPGGVVRHHYPANEVYSGGVPGRQPSMTKQSYGQPAMPQSHPTQYTATDVRRLQENAQRSQPIIYR